MKRFVISSLILSLLLPGASNAQDGAAPAGTGSKEDQVPHWAGLAASAATAGVFYAVSRSAGFQLDMLGLDCLIAVTPGGNPGALFFKYAIPVAAVAAVVGVGYGTYRLVKWLRQDAPKAAGSAAGTGLANVVLALAEGIQVAGK